MNIQNNWSPEKTAIKCSVENCIYHQGKHDCTAKAISVGPQSASCCQDTVCATFQKAKGN